jgi:hypothetical protein
VTSDSWLKFRVFHDFLRYCELWWGLLFLLIADGEHAIEGLLVRSARKDTGLEENVYERRVYAIGIQGALLKRFKGYSTDSTEFEEVEPGSPAWSKSRKAWD